MKVVGHGQRKTNLHYQRNSKELAGSDNHSSCKRKQRQWYPSSEKVPDSPRDHPQV